MRPLSRGRTPLSMGTRGGVDAPSRVRYRRAMLVRASFVYRRTRWYREPMATKAERARWQQERSGPKKPKRPRRPRRDVPVDTSLPGVSATHRKAGLLDTADRNRSTRAAKKGGAALESSATKPSRKSTRRSEGRVKRTTNLQLETVRQRVASPAARARKARARRR